MTEEERLQWAKDAEKNPAIWESFEVLKKTYMQQASLSDRDWETPQLAI